jgi:hypothetical protein
MSENILEKVADTVLEKPVVIEVDVAGTWYKKAHKATFELRPITLGSLIKISKLLLSIDDKINSQDWLNSSYAAMEKHGNTIAKIIAIAIHNRKSDPPASLVNLVLHNFTSKELLSTLAIVLKQMGVSTFISSIVSMKGLNILVETSPKEQGSQIASGALSAV